MWYLLLDFTCVNIPRAGLFVVVLFYRNMIQAMLLTWCQNKRPWVNTRRNSTNSHSFMWIYGWSEFLPLSLSLFLFSNNPLFIHTHTHTSTYTHTPSTVPRHLRSVSRKLSVATAWIKASKVQQHVCSTSLCTCLLGERPLIHNLLHLCHGWWSIRAMGVLNWMKHNRTCWTALRTSFSSLKMGSLAFGLCVLIDGVLNWSSNRNAHLT